MKTSRQGKASKEKDRSLCLGFSILQNLSSVFFIRNILRRSSGGSVDKMKPLTKSFHNEHQIEPKNNLGTSFTPLSKQDQLSSSLLGSNKLYRQGSVAMAPPNRFSSSLVGSFSRGSEPVIKLRHPTLQKPICTCSTEKTELLQTTFGLQMDPQSCCKKLACLDTFCKKYPELCIYFYLVIPERGIRHLEEDFINSKVEGSKLQWPSISNGKDHLDQVDSMLPLKKKLTVIQSDSTIEKTASNNKHALNLVLQEIEKFPSIPKEIESNLSSDITPTNNLEIKESISQFETRFGDYVDPAILPSMMIAREPSNDNLAQYYNILKKKKEETPKGPTLQSVLNQELKFISEPRQVLSHRASIESTGQMDEMLNEGLGKSRRSTFHNQSHASLIEADPMVFDMNKSIMNSIGASENISKEDQIYSKEVKCPLPLSFQRVEAANCSNILARNHPSQGITWLFIDVMKRPDIQRPGSIVSLFGVDPTEGMLLKRKLPRADSRNKENSKLRSPLKVQIEKIREDEKRKKDLHFAHVGQNLYLSLVAPHNKFRAPYSIDFQQLVVTLRRQLN